VQKIKGNKLQVFSGKEATLNHQIFLTLLKKPMIPYDIYLTIKATKGFRHKPYKTICRRIHNLHQQQWLTITGTRNTKPSGTSPLYTLTLKAQAALKLSTKTLDEYLQTATEQQLTKLIEALTNNNVLSYP
jgi:DNA-binding PadR family transcriptional regulator